MSVSTTATLTNQVMIQSARGTRDSRRRQRGGQKGRAGSTKSRYRARVGTSTGQLFGSRDEGRHWSLLADFLPGISSVEAVTLDA